ncbi:1,4-dihydroxy-2-naphthoate polyprenyltransferase [Tessaracoccus antarcticus]|uniref:1,4-dihydroxy-2-naphthoate octaprenyltransferase n=1 Tax=Tessaracoccus antarcticus TaxID=2479848 RepID=A0A3M0G268_9ACTN|nr:1,4-dihydroxy-2-naphthoate polyprenyltransferase [Tessaracoccus antarcticus]RMB58217.1 1,4-dihydroxy-2-naphthoate polyprenyltransferase [Tessaracoccus antarcticus]
MTDSFSVWMAGARPRTLPAALAPILAGIASALAVSQAPLTGRFWGIAALCFVVALALQVGVNYANDYSDGIRGTDDDRVGPTRLVASGLASPAAVKGAAFASFGVAAVAGLVVVLLTGHWWLLAIGAAAIVAAWFYTGGSHPYGYLGLGEVFVFVFFGLVATVGTTYVLLDRAPAWSWVAAVAIGSLASALLVVNNLRDVETDRRSGKRTLATKLGDGSTRWFYVALVAVAVGGVVVFASLTTWWALVALLAFGVLVLPIRDLLMGARGRALIGTLQATGMAELGVGLGLLVGVFIG